MCIVFFNSHPENRRQHCVVQYHCAHEGCPGLFESHHKFLLESTCADCSECLKEDGVQVDPDVVPVGYYPPIEHFEIERVGLEEYVRVFKRGGQKDGKEGGNGSGGGEKDMRAVEGGKSAETRQEEDVEDEGEEMAEEDDDWCSYKSLSDVDSVTSHWRLDEVDTSPEPVPHAVTSPARQQEPDLHEEEPHALSSRQSPYEAAPEEVPGASVAYQPTVRSASPETAMHRNLVNEQLAKLPRHIAHTREHSPSAFDTTGSPAPFAPPAPSVTPGQQWVYGPPGLHGPLSLYPPPGLYPHPPPDTRVYLHDSRFVYTTMGEPVDVGKWYSGQTRFYPPTVPRQHLPPAKPFVRDK